MMDQLAQSIAALAGDGVIMRAALAPLSGLDRAAAARVPGLLAMLPIERQRQIVESLVGEAERSFDLDFMRIYRVLLNHADPVIRRLCVEGLWEDERLDLIKPLIHLMEHDADIMVRAAAASALGRFIYAGEIEEIPATHARLVRQALERQVQDITALPEVARQAIEALSFINDDAIKAYIDRAYAAEQDALRLSAVFAMGRNADPCWADIVLSELYSDSPAMRYEAARACGELQLNEAIETLERMIGERDVELRYMAIQALGQIGGPEARKVLEQYQDTEDLELSEAIDEALVESSLADMSFDLMEIDPLDAELVPDHAAEQEEELDKEQEDFRAAFHKYTSENGDEDEEWPDEFFSLD